MPVTKPKGDNQVTTLLIKDPDLPWSEAFPYHHLSESLRQRGYPEVTPSSTSRRIKDVLFDLMSRPPVSTGDRLAWDNLRKTERRLPVDFLMYFLEVSDGEIWSEELWELPMPLHLPDFRELADAEPDYEKMIPVPASVPVPPLPAAAALDEETFSEFVNIGPAVLDDSEFLGDEHV